MTVTVMVCMSALLPYAAFVPTDKITGRAVLVVWPASRWSKLGVPDTFKSVPPAAEPGATTG